MSERFFIYMKDNSMFGFKNTKKRAIMLLVGNVAGYKLKPFVIWHSENFKYINKHTLPVY